MVRQTSGSPGGRCKHGVVLRGGEFAARRQSDAGSTIPSTDRAAPVREDFGAGRRRRQGPPRSAGGCRTYWLNMTRRRPESLAHATRPVFPIGSSRRQTTGKGLASAARCKLGWGYLAAENAEFDFTTTDFAGGFRRGDIVDAERDVRPCGRAIGDAFRHQLLAKAGTHAITTRLGAARRCHEARVRWSRVLDQGAPGGTMCPALVSPTCRVVRSSSFRASSARAVARNATALCDRPMSSPPG